MDIIPELQVEKQQVQHSGQTHRHSTTTATGAVAHEHPAGKFLSQVRDLLQITIPEATNHHQTVAVAAVEVHHPAVAVQGQALQGRAEVDNDLQFDAFFY